MNDRRNVPAEYTVWAQMWSRTRKRAGRDYENYVLRGITVCERWQKFENFFEDMGLRPSSKHSIDRENNDGNYEPGNCRWATSEQQARNQRIKKTNISVVKGVHWRKDIKKWGANIRVNGRTQHLGYYEHQGIAAIVRAIAEDRRDGLYG